MPKQLNARRPAAGTLSETGIRKSLRREEGQPTTSMSGADTSSRGFHYCNFLLSRSPRIQRCQLPGSAEIWLPT